MKRMAASVTALFLALCLAGCGTSGGSTNATPDTTNRPSAEEPAGETGEQAEEQESAWDTPIDEEQPVTAGEEQQPTTAGEEQQPTTADEEQQPAMVGEEQQSVMVGKERSEGAEEASSGGVQQDEDALKETEDLPAEESGGNGQAGLQEEYVVPSDSDIIGAITAYNHEMFPDAEFDAASYVVYATGGVRDDDSIITMYLMALFQGYDFPDGRPEMVCGASGPAALTFRNTGDGFQLTEYWVPDDGSEYMPSLREKFPSTIPEEDLDKQKFIQQLTADCDAQAEAYAESRAG